MEKLKRIWIKLVKLCGWKLIIPKEGTRPELEHCVFIVAPHTSALDFIIGATYLWSCCSNGKVFIKKEFFRWPLGGLLRGLGCISVDRGNPKNDMVGTAVKEFNENEKFSIAITPEGTRKPVKRWKSGFWRIAHEAKVPIVPTYINFKTKEIGVYDTIYSTDNYEADLLKVRKLYKKDVAKHPDQFIEVWKLKKVLKNFLSTFFYILFNLNVK